MASQGVPKDHRVQVGAVAREEHERVLAVEFAHAADPALVDVELVRPRHPAGELVPDVDGEPALTGHHLVEGGRGVAHDLGRRFIHGPGQLVDRLPEAGGLADLLGHEPRDLVAPARERALLALEREPALPGDERGEFAVGLTAAGDARESLPQLAESRRGSDDQPRAGGVVLQDPPLHPDARPARIGERQQVDHGPAAHAAALRREPCQRDGRDRRVAGAAGQAGGKIRVGRIEGLAVHVRLAEPAIHLGALDRRSCEDQMEGPRLGPVTVRDSALSFGPGAHGPGPVLRSLISFAGHDERSSRTITRARPRAQCARAQRSISASTRPAATASRSAA